MNISIKEIRDPQEWNNYVIMRKFTPDTQSSEYGKFYQSMNEEFFIFGIYDEEDVLIGGSLVVTVHAKRGNFLFLPYGPIIDNISYIKEFFIYLKKFALEKNLHFIRISPFIEYDDELMRAFTDIGFRAAPMHMLAEHTWILDLSIREEELLSGMSKNHRNLVRRCEKSDIKIVITDNPDSLDSFHNLLDMTAKRHSFVRFSRKYINEEFISFKKKNRALLLLGYLPDGSLDAGAIIYMFGDTASYRHGASLGQDKRLPTSYLIQWRAIQESKKRGMKLYNFWGVAPDDASHNHPFFGITHFKKGFGGRGLNLIKCLDLPLRPKYWFNWFVEMVRKKKRGFA